MCHGNVAIASQGSAPMPMMTLWMLVNVMKINYDYDYDIIGPQITDQTTSPVLKFTTTSRKCTEITIQPGCRSAKFLQQKGTKVGNSEQKKLSLRETNDAKANVMRI